MSTQPAPPTNLADVYRRSAERWPDRPAFVRHHRREKRDEPLTYGALHADGLAVAEALIDLGVNAREHVGLLADNRPEWALADCGILTAGAADVPRGTDITADEIAYILDHADVRVAILENAAVLAKFEKRRADLPDVKTLILMDEPPEGLPEGGMLFSDLLARGRELRASGSRNAEERRAAIEPDDLFTLIYTSGTTGRPKGVQLTHANMMSQVRNIPVVVTEDDVMLSILPIWHSYERVFMMLSVAAGATTHYTSVRTIADDLKRVRPTIMASAPRLWEAMYNKIITSVSDAPAVRRGLFNLAVGSARLFRGAQFDLRGWRAWTKEEDRPGAGRRAWLALRMGLVAVPYAVGELLVLRKLRGVLGGRLRGTISGGGALPPFVDEFFNFIGVPVLEGYGMTETCPVIAVRRWDRCVLESVGPLYPETEVRIVDHETKELIYPNPKLPHQGRGVKGEIHARGPQVMKGYYRMPEQTAAVLQDGWMNTGDLGIMTFNNCLKIVGRSKETIVLSSGENVEPVPIEARLCESALIHQCMVVGQDRKNLAVLVVPSVDELKRRGIAAEDLTAAGGSPEVQKLLTAEIRRLVNDEAGFKAFERVTGHRCIPKPFEVGEELTNTFKLRRHVITEQYSGIISEIYGE